ncbi:MAG: nucleotidyltransferase domain-containing protein [Parcubacteria group bacterium]|nr:nucleotidyltransferase domain-containing protein [Parcubacteria group bacterium]
MRLEHQSAEELKKEILGITGKYLDLTKYRLFFFGSRVAGDGDEHSDVDVGIDGIEPLPPGAISSIQQELDDLNTLYKIQAVDFQKVSEDFRRVALSKVEIINQQDEQANSGD